MSQPNTYQVAIVGGGPVGMGLAIDLGQRGVRCAVVERHPAPQPVPKGQNLTQRTMEHFHVWHCEAAVRSARVLPGSHGIGGMTSYGTLLSGYHYDWLQRALMRPYYFTDNERLPQYATEQALRDRVADLPGVDVIYGWDGVGVDQDATGVTVHIADHHGSARQTLRADYLVGCDGSHSSVRDLAAMPQTKSDHDRLMVLLVFRSPELHVLTERFPDKSYFSVLHPDHQGYWLFFGRVDLGNTWFFHAPVPPGTTAENFDFHTYLEAAVGAEFAVEFQHIGFWDLRIAMADSYRSGRVLLAGDAAHSHPPYGGFGINTGFEDARNLAWKLAAQYAGWGNDALLDTYDTERRPVFASTARDFIQNYITTDKAFLENYAPDRDLQAFETAWNARAGDAHAEIHSFAPNYAGSPIISGPLGAVSNATGGHDFTARAGHHLAPQPFTAIPDMLDALGGDFTLIALDGDPAIIDAFVAAAGALQLPMQVIADTRDGSREKYAAPYILVRPDHFVAWAGEAPPDPGAILSRAVAA